MTEDSQFLSTGELARLLGLRPQTLRRWRSRGCGPRFVRFGDTRRGRVRYARRDVAGWIEGQRVKRAEQAPHN